MGNLQPVSNVRPIAGVLAADQEWLDKAQALLAGYFGPMAAASLPVSFTHTHYYAAEMGEQLWRQFLVFEKLRPAEELADWKLAANALEREAGTNERGGRRLNLDPGYLAPGKLVLASTKNHEHRLYLRDGVYAEVTLRIRQRRFAAWPWTYPDYDAGRDFFDSAYAAYLQVLGQAGQTQGATLL
ncbi:MAG: DUF4416 family protein [candidate division FCPU426 bacterium]